MNSKNDRNRLKKFLIEWGIIGLAAALLYLSGLHTEVIGTLQRGMLWTGLFDAETPEAAVEDGPTLDGNDYGFALEDPQGNIVSLRDFKDDVVFLNVWASWCPPCIAEMPTIRTLYQNVGQDKDIRFILLSLDEKRQKAIDFMKRKEFEMPYYFPASGLPSEFRSSYLPTTYVISKEGQIVYKKEGIADYSSPEFAHWLRSIAVGQNN